MSRLYDAGNWGEHDVVMAVVFESHGQGVDEHRLNEALAAAGSPPASDSAKTLKPTGDEEVIL